MKAEEWPIETFSCLHSPANLSLPCLRCLPWLLSGAKQGDGIAVLLLLLILLSLSPGSGPQRGDEEPEREQEGGASHPQLIIVEPRVP